MPRGLDTGSSDPKKEDRRPDVGGREVSGQSLTGGRQKEGRKLRIPKRGPRDGLAKIWFYFISIEVLLQVQSDLGHKPRSTAHTLHYESEQMLSMAPRHP